MTSPLLQLTSVTKSFGSVCALKGVSFDLRGVLPATAKRCRRATQFFTVSASMIGTVTSYAERQEEHHRKVNFTDKLKRLLEKYGVKYDPKYLV
jgi:hypothetical protein